jgi:hypothetical protein
MKKNFFSRYFFLNFWSLKPWIRIRIGIQPYILDPDEMNADRHPCFAVPGEGGGSAVLRAAGHVTPLHALVLFLHQVISKHSVILSFKKNVSDPDLPHWFGFLELDPDLPHWSFLGLDPDSAAMVLRLLKKMNK